MTSAGDASLGKEGFLSMARQEMERESLRLEAMGGERKRVPIGWILAIALIIAVVVYILVQRDAILIWLVAAFVLYSFNFVLLFLPTSRRTGPKGKQAKISKEAKRPLAFLLKKRKKLAVEIGITMFLGGMFPLAYAFFVIFGIGLAFALYFVFIIDIYALSAGGTVIIQILVILGFLAIMLWIRPQERGVFRTARSFKGMLDHARSKGGLTSFIVASAIALVTAIIGIFSAGAILLTGASLQLVMDALLARDGEVLIALVVVLAVEVVIMRHFQMLASLRMARKMLQEKVGTIRSEVIAPLSTPEGDGVAAAGPEALERAKKVFYSMVIFEVIEHNFFGHAPVYMVGPNLTYILDEEALRHVD